MHVERTLGGLDVLLPYVKDYVNTFMGKSITTEQWRKHLYEYFGQHGGEEKLQALNSIDFKVGDRFSTSDNDHNFLRMAGLA